MDPHQQGVRRCDRFRPRDTRPQRADQIPAGLRLGRPSASGRRGLQGDGRGGRPGVVWRRPVAMIHAARRTVMRSVVAAIVAILVLAGPSAAATVDGATIHWTSRGSGGPAVIFVHGWTCDGTSWEGQVPAISRSHRVITLDLPG